MRIALFSDIHGNLPGLQAVLKAVDELGGADVIVCAGDMICGGPGHADVLDLLVEQHIRMVRGNHEELYLDTETHIHKVPEEFQEFIHRTHDYLNHHIDESHRQLLAGLPLTIEIPIYGRTKLLVCHASPVSPWDNTCNPQATEQELTDVYGAVDAELVAYGHWHWHHTMRFRDQWLINVASVGLRDDGLSSLTLLDTRPGGWTIRQLQIPYNTDEEERLMRIRNVPRLVN